MTHYVKVKRQIVSKKVCLQTFMFHIVLDLEERHMLLVLVCGNRIIHILKKQKEK